MKFYLHGEEVLAVGEMLGAWRAPLLDGGPPRGHRQLRLRRSMPRTSATIFSSVS